MNYGRIEVHTPHYVHTYSDTKTEDIGWRVEDEILSVRLTDRNLNSFSTVAEFKDWEHVTYVESTEE